MIYIRPSYKHEYLKICNYFAINYSTTFHMDIAQTIYILYAIYQISFIDNTSHDLNTNTLPMMRYVSHYVSVMNEYCHDHKRKQLFNTV